MKMIISLTVDGRGKHRKRQQDIVSQTIARSGTANPRNEQPYWTIAYFTAQCWRYAWNKLAGTAALNGNRPAVYRESIPVTTIEYDKKTGEQREVTRNRIVKRRATFDTNLLDDCIQQSLFYWTQLGYEPRAAMFFGVRHYITATQRLKVTGNSEKAIELAPSVNKYEDKLCLQTADSGEMAMIEYALDMPNLVQMAFNPPKPVSEVITKGGRKGRKLSKKTIEQRRSTANGKLAKTIREWFREAPTAHEQETMKTLSSQRSAWNKWVKENRQRKIDRYNRALARLAFGPPCYDDYLTIFLHREAQRKYGRATSRRLESIRKGNSDWAHKDFGFSGPRVTESMMPNHIALRISNPRLCAWEEWSTMEGAGMGI